MRWKAWDRVRIERTGRAGTVDGIAPVIISASRSTDIPAFFGPWFTDRLNEGYAKWINPFNGRPQFVSFEKTRLFVFWSKNPAPFLERMEDVGKRGYSYYLHFTLNDYESEGLEPNLPSLESRIAAFEEISDTIGKGRVIWRADPFILSRSLTPEGLLSRLEHIGEALHRKTRRMIISFIDIEKYGRVKRNIAASGCPDARELSLAEIEELAAGLRDLNRRWGLEISTCGEKIDLSSFGIQKGQCINYDLMVEEFGHDAELMMFLHRDQDVGREDAMRFLKDTGQRGRCGCIASKDIGHYNTCMHLCSYCYANSSPAQVARNYARYMTERRNSGSGEAILE